MWRSTRIASRSLLPRPKVLLISVTAALAALSAAAGESEVIDVKVTKTGERVYGFDVTVRHKDTGWDHYADRWEVVGPDGKVLATRVLYHPHVDEQPFTRSLTAVRIPRRVDRVVIRSRDKVHGYGGAEKSVPLPR